LRTKSLPPPARCVCVILIALSSQLAAQVEPDTASYAQPDTLLAVPDTIYGMRVHPFAGSLAPGLTASRIVTADQRNWLDYRSVGDILAQHPGIYIRSQSSAGQYDQINIRGADWRSVAITSDGRGLNDPLYGIHNLHHLSTDYTERIEVITGAAAFYHAFNGAGGVVNVVTRNYNSNRPLTRLNYSESAYNYSYTDGTFAQNISNSVNIHLGFQQQSTGGRFRNSSHEAWNLRGKLRYYLGGDFNIILSEYFTSSQTGLNGGVVPSQAGTTSGFTPLQATLRNTDSYEKITRNDLQLSLVGSILDDTSNVSDLTLYYSGSLREYRDEENRPNPNGIYITSDHRTSWMGGRVSQSLRLPLQLLSFGASLEVRQVEGSPNTGRWRNVVASAWGKDEFILSDVLSAAGYIRLDHFRKESSLGIGGDAELRLSGIVTLFGGLSTSRRFPTYQELFWTDSTVSRTEAVTSETHRMFEAGMEIRPGSGWKIRGAFFFRRIENPILLLPFANNGPFPGATFMNGSTINTNGIEFSLIARFGFIQVDGMALHTIQRSGGSTLHVIPKLVAQGGVYFRDNLLDGKLDLKAGFRGRYTSPQVGEEFNPEMLAYVYSSSVRAGLGGAVDFFLIGRIGSAHVHLMWENLTGVSYYSTPFFPVLDRAVRFGISWEFQN
jgi:outer membrane receptor protein involved in Fe transport